MTSEAALITHIRTHRWSQAALVATAVFAIYFLVSNPSELNNYYVPLADSLLHGRLYLTGMPDWMELARYLDNGSPCQGAEPGCKGYVIDPPVPAVLLVPFVAAFGTGFNQVLVSLLYGAVAMGLLWVATRRLGWDLRVSVAITALAALGTNFWANAADGRLWQFSHVCAVLFMMAALVEATGQKRPWLVGLLLGFAGLSRLPVFLGFPFFLYLVLSNVGDRRTAVRKAVLFGAGLGTMAAVDLAYNYARFHTIFDKGYTHPQYAHEPWFAQGRFSVSYIPRHIEAIFYLAPKLNEKQFPFFQPSVIGMALFLVTPAFLLAFAAAFKRIEIAAAVSIVLVAIPHVLHGVTGWTQFGYRFSLDYLPMLLVLTASGMSYRMSTRKWLLIGLSVFMAMWGPLFFYDTRLEDLIGYQWKL